MAVDALVNLLTSLHKIKQETVLIAYSDTIFIFDLAFGFLSIIQLLLS